VYSHHMQGKIQLRLPTAEKRQKGPCGFEHGCGLKRFESPGKHDGFPPECMFLAGLMAPTLPLRKIVGAPRTGGTARAAPQTTRTGSRQNRQQGIGYRCQSMQASP
jgi:hypothetical protein